MGGVISPFSRRKIVEKNLDIKALPVVHLSTRDKVYLQPHNYKGGL